MTQALWEEVDAYIGERLVQGDEALADALRASAAAGLPAIAVSAAHGKLLHLLARAVGARRILEIGTLGGYSAIWLARALPPDGRLVTLEIDSHHAATAHANLERAGVAGQVDIRVGAAIELLPKMRAGSFDLVFIDADKENNPAYFDHAVRLARPGALIVVDNVVRRGGVVDAQGNAQVQGVRRLFDAIHGDGRVGATAVQTVGGKGYDGFLVAVVNA